MRYDIRLSGSGGQGIIILSIILAEAAAIFDGRFVTQTQSYGPQARGGSSRADVVISDEEIDYPEAMRLDLLLAMNQASCDAYYTDLKPEGLLIVDSTLVTQIPLPNALALPFTRIARERLKKEMVANMVALGALAHASGIVSKRAIEKAVVKRVPGGTETLNVQALRAGMAAARKNRRTALPLTAASMPESEDL